MKTKEEILKEATKRTLNINEGSPLHDAVMKAMEEYAQQQVKKLQQADVVAMLPTKSQLDEIAFRKYGNDPEGVIKFNLIKRMAFVEGCEFMLRLLKKN